ncbi:MAG: autotransporter-associated beta strand repeat-containing protein, partial [Verrucomicrobiota bacterium]
MKKSGPGILTFSGLAAWSGGMEIADGSLRPGSADTLATQLITITSGGVLDLNGAPATVGGLTGAGAVQLGSGRLTIGALPGDTNYGGAIGGSGSVVITGGGKRFSPRTLSGHSTFTGGTVLESGRLIIGSTQALGTGRLTVRGGSVQTAPGIS